MRIAGLRLSGTFSSELGSEDTRQASSSQFLVLCIQTRNYFLYFLEIQTKLLFATICSLQKNTHDDEYNNLFFVKIKRKTIKRLSTIMANVCDCK